MTVFLVTRRGNWLYLLLRSVLPLSQFYVWPWLTRLLVGDSWMLNTGIMFNKKCIGAGCAVCREKGGGRAPRDGVHVFFAAAHQRDNAIKIIPELEFDEKDDPKNYLFIKLDIGDDAVVSFFSKPEFRTKTFSHEGYRRNFLPWFVSMQCTPKGVQADNDTTDVDSMFCSELATVFVQTHGYPLGLTPCTTSPTKLVDTLLKTYEHLQSHVYVTNDRFCRKLVCVKDL